jgi:hypothetical protein
MVLGFIKFITFLGAVILIIRPERQKLSYPSTSKCRADSMRIYACEF